MKSNPLVARICQIFYSVFETILHIVSPQSLSTWVLLSAVLLALISSLDLISDTIIFLLAIVLWGPAILLLFLGTNHLSNLDLNEGRRESFFNRNSSS